MGICGVAHPENPVGHQDHDNRGDQTCGIYDLLMQYHQPMHFPAPSFSHRPGQKFLFPLDTRGMMEMEPTTFASAPMHAPHLPPSSSSPSSTATIESIDSVESGHESSSNGDSPPPPSANKLKILYLGDPIQYNQKKYDELAQQFDVIHPEEEDLERGIFIRHLQECKWGDFSAILRPFWASGNQMKPWNKELIDLLPTSMKVMASAGAGYDWVDTEALASRGMQTSPPRSSLA